MKNKLAFTPFSSGKCPCLEPFHQFDNQTGVYGCVGKQLALMELRAVTAQLITNFDVSFAPGETGRELMEETKDVFTLHLAPLNLLFTARKE